MKRLSLSGFQLKYIALITMVFDHIHYFFDYTGKIPIWFAMIGRLAAPLFLFCVIEGFIHTHNRKKYFLKIYSLAIVMGLIQFGFYNFLHPLVRPDGFFPQNMMLSSFASMVNDAFLYAKCEQTYVWFSTKFTQFHSIASPYIYQ